jgi:galactarate dehydratase
VLLEAVPPAHKVALEDLPEGAPVIRYGSAIGRASRAIPRGSWIDESLVLLPEAPALDELPLITGQAPALPPLPGYSFEGYRNADGTVGTKNLLGIMTSVQCVAGVVNLLADRIRHELLPRYPNVDDVVAVNHGYGCGVAINAPGAAVPIRTLQNLARHPNFGGEAMIVGLGCEKLEADRLVPGGISGGLRGDCGGGAGSPVLLLQDESLRGFGDMMARLCGWPGSGWSGSTAGGGSPAPAPRW